MVIKIYSKEPRLNKANRLILKLSFSIWTCERGCNTAIHFGVKAKENQDRVPTLY